MENLYASSQQKEFAGLFAAPGAVYRDTPFWAWNCELDKEQTKRQILIFKEMGMGGFHMHARTGLGTPYLGEEFMKRVGECVETARDNQMLAWLYDEDRWPSGAAGGLVTKNPKYRARHLLMTSEKRTEAPDPENDNSGALLTCYSIRLDADGFLTSYRRIGENEAPEEGAEKFYLYLMVDYSNPWYNDQTYVDTLNPERYADITRGGNLKEALAGLEAALSYPELTVRINCVPMEDVPVEEYIRLAALAKEQNLDVRFIEMMPIGLGRKFAGVSGGKVCRLLAGAFGKPERCEGKFGNGPAVYVHFPGFKGKIGFIDAVSHQFCDKCNRVRLTSEGYLKPCLQYGTGADLRKLLRSGADDAVIRREMCRTIYEKPACHHFSAGVSGQTFETRDMSQIGG